MYLDRLVFRIHAIQRMFQRRISMEDIKYALTSCEIVEEYPEDKPYPSQLVLGWKGNRPLHAVIADNDAEKETIVITVYEPSLNEWEQGFKRRRSII